MPVRPSANAAGSTMVALGGCVSALERLMVTVTTALVAVLPRSSVARAVNVCTPVVTGVQRTENGGSVSAAPSGVAPSKNCTLATVPSLSVAVADSVIGVPGFPVLLFAGAVSATAGGALIAGPASMKTAVWVAFVAGVAMVCVAAAPSLQLMNWYRRPLNTWSAAPMSRSM